MSGLDIPWTYYPRTCLEFNHDLLTRMPRSSAPTLVKLGVAIHDCTSTSKTGVQQIFGGGCGMLVHVRAIMCLLCSPGGTVHGYRTLRATIIGAEEHDVAAGGIISLLKYLTC